MSSRSRRPVCVVVDDFLDDPDEVRRVALAQRFVKMHCAGLRTVQSFLHLAPYEQAFERLLGSKLPSFGANAANGCFQLCTARDAIPYHSDSASYAGVLFLTPDAPLDAGLSFFRNRRSGMRGRCADPELMAQTFGRDAEFDRSCWEEIDRVANVYNRLVLFNAHLAHGATAYFGSGLEDGRLFQNFFFDVATDELSG